MQIPLDIFDILEYSTTSLDVSQTHFRAQKVTSFPLFCIEQLYSITVRLCFKKIIINDEMNELNGLI
jgi:hypothetical protein